MARVSSGRLPLGASAAERTSLGIGVPIAPCCLDLEDDETAACVDGGNRSDPPGDVIHLRFGMSSYPPNGFVSVAPSRTLVSARCARRPRGAQLSTKSFNHLLKRVSIEILHRPLNPHALRHSCATYMAENGAELSVICDHLGHSDLNVARNFYVHLSTERRRRVTREALGG